MISPEADIPLVEVRAQRMYQHMECTKTSLQSSPNTEVMWEPNRQSPGQTRDLLVSRSLILPRPTNSRGKPNVKDESRTDNCFRFYPPAMFNFNFTTQSCADVQIYPSINSQEGCQCS